MTNYESLQKSSPDIMIENLIAMNCDPCKGCVLQCSDSRRKRLEIFLKEDFDCNTERNIISDSVCIERLWELRNKYFNIIKTSKDTHEKHSSIAIETFKALEYAIDLLKDLGENNVPF